MSEPSSKRRRVEIKASIKKSVCLQKQKQPRLSQADLVKFVKESFQLDVGRSTIADILKSKDKWLQVEDSKAVGDQTRKRCPKYEKMEEALLLWFQEARKHNLDLNDAILIHHAKNIGAALGVDDEFKYSEGWLQKFKSRNGIKRYKKEGEASSANMDDVEAGRLRLQALLKDKNRDDIYNLDESGLYFRMDHNATLDTARCSGKKLQKDRMTAGLTTNASGTDKRKPLLIWKYNRPRCFKKTFNPSFYCDWYFNKKAWMTGIIFQDWLLKFDKQMRLENRHVILLLDNAPSHQLPDVELTNVSIEFLPPNTTAFLQPLDAGIIRNWKLKYRTQQMHYYYECYINNEEPDMNPKQAIKFIHQAWKDVKTSTIVNCWKKTGILGEAVENTHDDSAEAEADLQHLLDSMPDSTSCTAEQLVDVDTDLPDADMMSIQDAIDAVTRPCSEEEDTTDDHQEQEEVQQVITMKEGRQLGEQFMLFLEQNPDIFGEEDCHHMNSLINKMAEYSRKKMKSTKISDFFAIIGLNIV